MNFRTIGILVVAGMLFFWGCNVRNGLASADQSVRKQWSEVENQYQRRFELIPNLVNTVKGAADFERGTLEAVIQARSSASQIKVDPNDLNPESIRKFQEAQGQLGSVLNRLMVLTENYPQLRATEQFQKLSDELAGTENRIAVARKDFNTSVQGYNEKLVRFPANMIASITGFKEKGYFTADAGASRAPTVDFK
jgi:LemA protein